MSVKQLLVVFLLTTASVLGRKGFGPTEQEWGFVEVRPNAHMFWWLQQTLLKVTDYTKVPLVIWLPGAPGSPSGSPTEYGNFQEIGPLDTNLEARETTWLKNYNLLFVDSPVGTGFSYVEDEDAFVTTKEEIAEDFVVFLRGFYEALPELRDTPLYIFGEFCGGKITAEIALAVDKAVKAGTLDANLVGIGLGNSWISPIGAVLAWAPYLLNLGAIDQNGYDKILQSALETQDTFDKGDHRRATSLWAITENVVLNVTYDIDFYNVLNKVSRGSRNKLTEYSPDETMNQVRDALGLEQKWTQNVDVFYNLATDFMVPATETVELLLNTTDIRVAVYNGQLDLIVDTPGAVKWVEELKFDGAPEWKAAERHPIVAEGTVEGYYKRNGNLAFYWVDRAGHKVSVDNTAAMDFILEDVISAEWKK